jgi:peptide-methionine (S)-S-oxide reductase
MTKFNERATLGAGCFWCLEAIYRRLKGVTKVLSGYSGGHIINPVYKEVCEGRTGHAEVCELEFDPRIITFKEILEVYWLIHDPTTLNRQGNDVGTEYRSAIFYHSEIQKQVAEESKLKYDARKIYPNPIVTEITKWKNFYPAGEDHNSFFENHREEPYCRLVVLPKVEKLIMNFPSKLKKAED